VPIRLFAKPCRYRVLHSGGVRVRRWPDAASDSNKDGVLGSGAEVQVAGLATDPSGDR